MEQPPKKFFRLAPGCEVRLRYGYVIKCQQIIRNEQGEIIELHCSHDPETAGGVAAQGRKVKGIIHWVCAKTALTVEVRQYERLFSVEQPGVGKEGSDYRSEMNPDSLQVLTPCYAEATLADAAPGAVYQFERLGYFCADSHDSTAAALVFNRSVTLRDVWNKSE